ncbi:MAG: very short patch repair endonuclease [Deltaproteobacteria bacterium]|jgi:DNA mismatch endonuclease (patch repair protein)|nr:very short patch repair endonuclease [Deltaproteobacteria bacterium]
MERTPEVTHKIMSAIRSNNTKPEMLLRKTLWHKGLRFRLHYQSLPGKPDIVFTKAKIAVFCDGDYWHGHNWAIRGLPSLEDELAGYSEYWRNKILKNVQRDTENTKKLEANGWTVLRFWESDIKCDVSSCANVVETIYRSRLEHG